MSELAHAPAPQADARPRCDGRQSGSHRADGGVAPPAPGHQPDDRLTGPPAHRPRHGNHRPASRRDRRVRCRDVDAQLLLSAARWHLYHRGSPELDRPVCLSCCLGDRQQSVRSGTGPHPRGNRASQRGHAALRPHPRCAAHDRDDGSRSMRSPDTWRVDSSCHVSRSACPSTTAGASIKAGRRKSTSTSTH